MLLDVDVASEAVIMRLSNCVHADAFAVLQLNFLIRYTNSIFPGAIGILHKVCRSREASYAHLQPEWY